MWGAVIAAGASIVGSAISGSSARSKARWQAALRDKYSGQYKEYLSLIESQQQDQRAITNASNEISLAQYRRDLARQDRVSASQAQAGAYLGGLSESSSLQGLLGGMSLDSLTGLSDVTSAFNVNLLQSDINQRISLFNTQAQNAANMANQYGAAIQTSNQMATQAQGQMWQSAGQLAGSIAGYYWG